MNDVRKTPVAKVVRALGARLMFATHGLISLWRLCSIYSDEIYWLLSIFLIILFIEGGLIIYQRHGNETTGFCLSVFLYLCAVVPAICLLQLDLCRKSIHRLDMQNFTLGADINEITELKFLNDFKISIYLPFGQEVWVQMLQQTMMLVLILGRWILPKGDISRDHLSQILLVFLGMAADMVTTNRQLTTIVLGVWALSLVQFPLVLTGVSPRKIRPGYLTVYYRTAASINRRMTGKSRIRPMFATCKIFAHLLMADMNFWGVVSGIFLQDAPFLVTRLYLLFEHKTISYMMIFFTVKNLMVLLLQSYRLYVICLETNAKLKETRSNVMLHELQRCDSKGLTPEVVKRIKSPGPFLPTQSSVPVLGHKIHSPPARSFSQSTTWHCPLKQHQSCSSLHKSTFILANNNAAIENGAKSRDEKKVKNDEKLEIRENCHFSHSLAPSPNVEQPDPHEDVGILIVGRAQSTDFGNDPPSDDIDKLTD